MLWGRAAGLFLSPPVSLLPAFPHTPCRYTADCRTALWSTLKEDSKTPRQVKCPSSGLPQPWASLARAHTSLFPWISAWFPNARQLLAPSDLQMFCHLVRSLISRCLEVPQCREVRPRSKVRKQSHLGTRQRRLLRLQPYAPLCPFRASNLTPIPTQLGRTEGPRAALRKMQPHP